MTTRAYTQGYQYGYRSDIDPLPEHCPYEEGTQDFIDWNVGFEESTLDKRAGR